MVKNMSIISKVIILIVIKKIIIIQDMVIHNISLYKSIKISFNYMVDHYNSILQMLVVFLKSIYILTILNLILKT